MILPPFAAEAFRSGELVTVLQCNGQHLFSWIRQCKTEEEADKLLHGLGVKVLCEPVIEQFRHPEEEK